MYWFWFAVAASILWGLSFTINQATLSYFSEIEVLFFDTIIAFIILTVYLVLNGGMSVFVAKLFNPKMLGLISCSGIIYIVASFLILKSIAASNASIAAIIESAYPIFTVIFAFLFFGRFQLNLFSALGCILILSGIIIVKINN